MNDLSNAPPPSLVNVTVYSFSYKDPPKFDYPPGGGFIFDARCLPNPGRLPEFAELNGQHLEVKRWLDEKKEAQRFFQLVLPLVEMAIANHKERGYKEPLLIGFGCTGGQHRSVYFVEKLEEYLRSNQDVALTKIHLMCF
ncbi:MAG TPA: RNase adapter RapZ [Oligoflexia bacterium]|mgnify:CR=1 FL=1|nr:RNase adapter RapZ [Oligoflexia bacterium]HMP27544.1 RNase adapter RapZ [Oligoflexia bacterium]